MQNDKSYTIRVESNDHYNWVDKILMIVEDIELNYLYLKELLEPTGAIIIRCKNGKEALDYCKNENTVDLILMDLLMPVMNGYDATRQIKNIRREIPIIAQTAYSMSEDRKHAIEAGCDDYIAKPISRDMLLSKIDKFIC